MTTSESVDARLLPGFERRFVELAAGRVLALVGGSGPPLLMLHGDPQTHLCWHRLAPALATRFTVVLSDLRGRGESHAPAPSPDAASNPYAKRVTALEQLELVRALGFERFALVGHDRGARVARRLALDHPHAVTRLVVMDVVPALDLYESVTAELAQDYFWFFFLTQPHPEPESLIAGDPDRFMRRILTELSADAAPYDAEALELYVESAARPASIAAMCECFRAGFAIDREHDAEDRRRGRRIECPTLAMWGERGVVARHFDVPAVWERWCTDVRFAPMSCGHFIPEEAPDATLAALDDFLRPGGTTVR